MLALIRYALSLYFAAMLGVAGLAKLDRPTVFLLILRQQRLLPGWGVRTVGRGLPWGEIILAGALVAGVSPVPIAILTLLLFASFVAHQILHFLTKRGTPCGCYGAAVEGVEQGSIATGTVFACLAGAHLWLVIQTSSVTECWRLTCSMLFTGMMGWLGRRIWQRHARHVRCRIGTRSSAFDLG